MIYLNKYRFFESKDNETYHNDEISREEYRDLFIRKLPFDDFEFNQIKKLCSEFSVTALRTHFIGAKLFEITLLYVGNPRIIINKIDDEWYLCKYIKENRYCKCDTFEGLMKELKRYLN